VAISNRHIHICRANFEKLFGEGKVPTADRMIVQPGQYAAHERVRVVGPGGAIDNVRIVGPLRDHTQVELAASDCRRIGVDAPVRDSGSVAGSAGVRLEGPAGQVDLTQGVIMASAHLHLNPSDSQRMGLDDGQRVAVMLGGRERLATLHDVLVRAGPTHETEIHVDTDEANALGVATGDLASIVGRPSRGRTEVRPGRKPLITERDVAGFAARGEQLTDCGAYIVTPAARDRARALGLWRD
jgi:putative phosphotransacetylase